MNAILLTEDSDFGTLAFSYKTKIRSVIFLRYRVSDVEKITENLIKVLNKYNSKLFNKFVTVTKDKIRIRSL